MTSVRLTKEIEDKLDSLCSLTNLPRSHYIREAVSRYMDDMEDVHDALKRISSKDKSYITTEELLNLLGDK